MSAAAPLALAALALAAACLWAAGLAAAGRGAWRVAWAYLRRTLQAAASYRLRIALGALNAGLGIALLVLVARGLLLPALGGALRSAAGAGALAYLVVGVAAWPAAWAGYQASSATMRREQVLGTLEVVAATPVGAEAVPFASLVVQGAGALATAGATLAFLSFLLPVGLRPSPADAGLALAALALAMVCLWGLGLLVGALSTLHKDVGGADSLLRFGLVVVSGAYIPLAALPGWAQAAGALVPVSAAFQVVRDAMGGSAAAVPTLLRLGYLAGAALLAAAIGSRALRGSLLRARRRGVLQGY